MLTIVCRELKNQLGSWLVWTGSISVLLAVCIFVYPQMQEEARGLGDAFSSMGAFTKAFGMDSLDFGSWPGFYALECGNVLGIGGAFYAALCGSQILSRETKGRTAEFLFSQPVIRTQVYLGKLLAVILEIVALNLVAAAVSLLCQQVIQETMPARAFWLLHTAITLVMLETAVICLGLSVFFPSVATGAGLGLVCLFYILNVISNIVDATRFLKWVTPFAYSDGAAIISDLQLDLPCLIAGLLLALTVLVCGWHRLETEDIR